MEIRGGSEPIKPLKPIRMAAVDPSPPANDPTNSAAWEAWTLINSVLCAAQNNPQAGQSSVTVGGLPGVNVTSTAEYPNFTINAAPNPVLMLAAKAVHNFALMTTQSGAYPLDPSSLLGQALSMMQSTGLLAKANNLINGTDTNPQELLNVYYTDSSGHTMQALAFFAHALHDGTNKCPNPSDNGNMSIAGQPQYIADLAKLKTDIASGAAIATLQTDYQAIVHDSETIPPPLPSGDTEGISCSIYDALHLNIYNGQSLATSLSDRTTLQTFLNNTNLNTIISNIIDVQQTYDEHTT